MTIKVAKQPYTPGGKRQIGQMCFSREEALRAAEGFNKLGKEPVIVRPLSGTKAWFVWVKE